MIHFKTFIKEDAFETRMKAQKERQETERTLESKLNKHYDDLDNHHDVLHKFTSDSRDVNSYLWNRHKDPKELHNESIEHKVHRLDSAVNHHHTPEDMVVWSKSKHDPRHIKNVDDIVHHPAYLSTSIKKSVAEQHFQGRNKVVHDGITHHHVYRIEVPKGHPGVYIPDHHSVDFRAKEFVLPRGTNMKHIKTETVEDGATHYHTHHMKVI